jgi:hypothetical protein
VWKLRFGGMKRPPTKKKRFSTLASTRAVASHVAILSTLCFCELSADNNKKCFQIVKKTIPRKKDEKAFFFACQISMR